MNRILIFRLCLFLSFLLLTSSQSGRLPVKKQKLIKEREELVRGLALYATELHSRRVQFVRECECSKHGCSNDFMDLPCVHRYGTQPFCDTKGWRMDFTDTIFRTAPGADPNDLSDSLKENICVYKHIYDYVEKYRASGFAWMYVSKFGFLFLCSGMSLATLDGHVRRYPSSARERGEEDGDRLLNGCRPYDPRVRPWFIAASTGPKDIVLVLDKSESMNEFVGRNKTKWDITVDAAKRMMDTFTFADFINVITFSDNAKPLNKKGLLRGTAENLEAFKEGIDKVDPKGKTHFETAFKTAFDQLTNYCEEEPRTCSNCHKIVLFLTDGRDTSQPFGDGIKPSKMAAVIEALQDDLVNKTGKRASIFTYSMSDQADDSIPRQAACSNDGAWAFIGPNTDVLNALNSYYLYIAAGRKDVNPVWVEPFEDAAGLGNITTVAMPFFAKGTSQVQDVFLGVAGHDVIISELEIDSATEDQVINTIVDRSERCTPSNSDPCEFQAYRYSRDPRGLCADPYPVEERAHHRLKHKDVQCYKFGKQFYKRFPEEVDWDDAVSRCKEDGGELVSIRDGRHNAFVASLASPDGSWVGSRRDDDGFEYQWLNGDVDHVLEDSDFWGVGEPQYRTGVEDCAAVDTRGIIGNMMARSCSALHSFICEYNSKKQCKAGVAKIPKEGYFTIPPLSACDSAVEVMLETKPIPEVAKLSSEDVMCPMGHRNRTTEAVICCPEGDSKN